MSMHNIPLADIERSGLEAHGLDAGKPSQLSDAFRQGMAWAFANSDKEAHARNAIDLRMQVDALKLEISQLRAGGQVTKGELERLDEFKRRVRENRR